MLPCNDREAAGCRFGVHAPVPLTAHSDAMLPGALTGRRIRELARETKAVRGLLGDRPGVGSVKVDLRLLGPRGAARGPAHRGGSPQAAGGAGDAGAAPVSPTTRGCSPPTGSTPP